MQQASGFPNEGGAMRVFIIDDSALVRERLIAMLSEVEEIEFVGHAEDAFAAVDGVREVKPDVVILDIQMPGAASGIYALEKIRCERPPPIVIMLTNYSSPQYRKRCADGGAAFFFDKSTEFEKVPEVLKALIHDAHRRPVVSD
jgi:DNA-binding NarL/FixJ family response regulator